MKTSIRMGFSNHDPRRPPGIGRHIGLFNMAGVDEHGGRNISVGRLTFERRDLEPLRERGIRLRVTAIGILRLADDVSPALVESVLDATVIGWVRADPRTRAALRTAG